MQKVLLVIGKVVMGRVGMEDSGVLIARLRERFGQDRVNEAEFIVAVAEILAASPENIEARESLMLSREIRELKEEWRQRY